MSDPNPVRVAIGIRLRTARLLAGMSQCQLAEAVETTLQQIQEYERGCGAISASRLFRLAEVLDVDIAFFFEGDVVDGDEEANENVLEQMAHPAQPGPRTH